MIPDINMRETYDTLFCIDDYKRAYVICFLKNQYIQKDGDVSHKTKRFIRRQSSKLSKMLRQIIKGNVSSIEEFLSLTHACAVVYSEIYRVFNLKIKKKNYEQDNLFKNLRNCGEGIFDTFLGQSALNIFFDNHLNVALVLIWGGSIVSFLVANSQFGNNIVTQIIFCFLIILSIVLVALVIKFRNTMSVVTRINRIKNKYTYLNSISMKKASKAAKEIISTISNVNNY